MNYRNLKLNCFLLFIAIVILQSSCKFEDEPAWDTQLLTPLINTNLNLGNLLTDSMGITNSDSSLSLIYRYLFQSIDFDEILRIPDTTVVIVFNLESLELGTKTIIHYITLGRVAQNMGAVGQLIIQANGSTLPIPPITNVSGSNVNIDATEFFESIEVGKGQLTVNIYNGFPIELRDMIYSIKNKNSGTIIVHDTILSLMPYASSSRITSIDGKFIEGNLIVDLINMNSPGSGTTPVFIDTSDALKVEIKVTVDEVVSAKAIFPAQDVVDDRRDVAYDMGGAAITFMKIKSGMLKIVVASTLQDTLYITYTMPEGRYFGNQALLVQEIIPPAEENDTVYMERIEPVDNYWVDFTGVNKDTVNTFYNIVTMRIDSTGRMVNLSLKDSVYVYYSLFDVIPEYVRGYIGQDTFEIGPSTMDLDIFNNIIAGKIDLQDLNLNLFVENGIGVEAELNVVAINATNSNNGKSIKLTSSILANPIAIPRAEDNPFKPGSLNVLLDKSNSNAKNLIEILPDKLVYHTMVFTNPNGNVYNYGDFVYNKSSIKAGIDIEMPLILSSNGLTLVDTLDFDMSAVENIKNVKSCNFKLIADNSFPLATDIQMYFVDGQGIILDSLLIPGSNRIMEAEVDSKTLRVFQAKRTRLNSFFNEERILKLQSTKAAIVRAAFYTMPQGIHLKLYSDYDLKIKLIADFTYRIQF